MKKCPKCGGGTFILTGDAYDSVEYLVTREDDGAVVTLEAGNKTVEGTDWHGDMQCIECAACFVRETFKAWVHNAPLLPFTVLLLYPDYIASTFGQETYCDQVYARTPAEAIDQAQKHALTANYIWDDGSGADPSDYYPLFTVRGHWNDLTPPELQV